MHIGRIFRLQDTLWMVDEIIPESNACHTWLKVVYSWSQFGPRPMFAEDKHFLIIDKRKVA